MNTRPETPSQGIGLQEAATRFEALFSEPSETEKKPVEQAAQHDEAETSDEVEALAADDAAEKTPSDDEADIADTDDDAADDEASDDADDEPAAPTDLDTLVTVKVDGKEEQVSLREALAGYSRTADYTRAKMALADDKRSFQKERETFTQERDAVRTERQQYAQILPLLLEELKSAYQEPDWDKLADNPTEFLRQQNLWRERQDRVAAAEEEQQRLYQTRLQEEREAIGSAIRASGAKLAEAMPQWKDQKRWEADRAKLIEYGVSQGYAPDELERTYDYRAILMVHKAMKYDEIVAKRQLAQKQQSNQGPKPAPVGSANRQPPRSVSNVNRAKQRLSKTGRVQDAATVFEALLGKG